MEIRVEAANIDVRTLGEFVVRAPGESPATPIVAVFTNIDGFKIPGLRPTRKRGDVRNRFDVVDAAAIPIVTTADEQPELLVAPETLTECARCLDNAAPTENR